MFMTNLYEKVIKANYIHLKEQTASYYTHRKGDTLYILFEGSNGKTDWRNNLDFPAKPYRNMPNVWFAHRGFLRTWKAIEPHLKDEIFDASLEQIIIGGYSHGAALALLCHEYCKFNRPNIRTVGYGYGCPRVVWGFIRKKVKERFEGFTVIRNGCDIVTHLPPKLFGFRHIGYMLKIGQNKGYRPIESHYPEAYISELKAFERG